MPRHHFLALSVNYLKREITFRFYTAVFSLVGRIKNKVFQFWHLQCLLDRLLQYYLTLNRERKSRSKSKDSRNERKIQSRIFSLKGLRVVRESRTVYATLSRIALEPVRIRNTVRFVLNPHQKKIVRDSTGFRQLFVYRGSTRERQSASPNGSVSRHCQCSKKKSTTL